MMAHKEDELEEKGGLGEEEIGEDQQLDDELTN